jgi:hypothetical protein
MICFGDIDVCVQISYGRFKYNCVFELWSVHNGLWAFKKLNRLTSPIIKTKCSINKRRFHGTPHTSTRPWLSPKIRTPRRRLGFHLLDVRLLLP